MQFNRALLTLAVISLVQLVSAGLIINADDEWTKYANDLRNQVNAIPHVNGEVNVDVMNIVSLLSSPRIDLGSLIYLTDRLLKAIPASQYDYDAIQKTTLELLAKLNSVKSQTNSRLQELGKTNSTKGPSWAGKSNSESNRNSSSVTTPSTPTATVSASTQVTLEPTATGISPPLPPLSTAGTESSVTTGVITPSETAASSPARITEVAVVASRAIPITSIPFALYATLCILSFVIIS